MSQIHQATCTAPVNIAVVKYWGKRDSELILPTNDSLSVTLDQDHLRTITTARADPAFGSVDDGTRQDRLWLNGVEDEIKEGGRLSSCISELRRMRAEREAADPSLPKVRGAHCAAVTDTAAFLVQPAPVLGEQLPDRGGPRVVGVRVCGARGLGRGAVRPARGAVPVSAVSDRPARKRLGVPLTVRWICRVAVGPAPGRERLAGTRGGTTRALA